MAIRPRTHLLALVLLAVTLLISGCGGPSGVTDVNYHQGSDGLLMGFTDNSPPEKVYPSTEFPVTVKLHDAGAFGLLRSESHDDIFASVTLIYDPFYFEEVPKYASTAQQLRDSIFIEGKSVYWPSGETRFLTLGVLRAKDIGSNRIGADSDIIASLCFPYETVLTTPVCVDNDPLGNDAGSKPCQAEDLSFTDQGAPVAVTSVEVEPTPIGTKRDQVLVRKGVTDEQGALIGFDEGISDELVTVLRPTFRLHLMNVGGGQVVRGRDRGEQKLCLKGPDDDLPGNSLVVTAYLGNKELVCMPDPIVMRDDVADVVCMMDPKDDLVVTTNYFDVLQVYVDYVYQVREKATVQIDDSLKSYTPPDFQSFQCLDFDNDYAACRTYGQSASGYRDALDCYYCQGTKKCGKAADCSNCPDGSLAEKGSRLCTSPCPTPSVSVRADIGNDKAYLACRDGGDVDPNERDRCGCSRFAYRFVAADSCSGVDSYDGEAEGKYSSGTAKAEISIPDYVRNGEQWSLCVVGSTSSNTLSEQASASISYPVDRVKVVVDENANQVA